MNARNRVFMILGLLTLGSLIWYLLSPAHRRKTNARWKASRPHKVVYEVGTGFLGLILIGAFFGGHGTHSCVWGYGLREG